jgi:hypothetical protein
VEVIVVKDPEIKRKIREAAEAEERESYDHRMPQDWLEALAPLGTDWHKEFLEVAPYLIVVFRIDFALRKPLKEKSRLNITTCRSPSGSRQDFCLRRCR